ncbi:3-beta hydroxysteroid dehydrogenase/isomerase family-domain-containing protein [Kalaharituber pfeilii]|nr:3-beta hydroxysteroid dehydrogenase/isomerase family-domain-containing protein [Kalaharituber pfeilii]
MSNPYPLKSVIVIGGCGFLGHHLVNLLQKQHPETAISVLDLHTSNNQFPGVTYINGDITKPEDVREAYRQVKPQVVINTVSPSAVSEAAEAVYFKVNVDGTRTTMEVAQEENIQCYVYTSSAGVVTDNVTDLKNVDESFPMPANIPDIYSRSKAKGERVVMEMNGKGGLNTCALRVAGLFGPGDRQLMSGLISVLKNKQTKFQLGDNENLFDFTYIENAAYAHILAAERLHSVAGQVFFITNGEPVYFWDLPRAVWAMYEGHVAPYHIKLGKETGLIVAWAAEMYSKLLGKEPGFTRFRVQYATTHRYFNIKKAKALLNYQPLFSLHEGLDISVKWFREQEQKQAEKKDQ